MNFSGRVCAPERKSDSDFLRCLHSAQLSTDLSARPPTGRVKRTEAVRSPHSAWQHTCGSVPGRSPWRAPWGTGSAGRIRMPLRPAQSTEALTCPRLSLRYDRHLLRVRPVTLVCCSLPLLLAFLPPAPSLCRRQAPEGQRSSLVKLIYPKHIHKVVLSKCY